ncbi:hypothetical protein, partial [Raoultella ornithinolytica]|uniref:hypothetical protein n=1 Tax=Raoultella ornithinolytica TaxID=54291 RepID=UPI001BD3833C
SDDTLDRKLIKKHTAIHTVTSQIQLLFIFINHLRPFCDLPTGPSPCRTSWLRLKSTIIKQECRPDTER